MLNTLQNFFLRRNSLAPKLEPTDTLHAIANALDIFNIDPLINLLPEYSRECPNNIEKLKKTSVELEEIKNTLASFEKKEAIAVHLCTLIVNDKTSTVTKLNFIVNLCSLIKSNALHLALESKEEILPPLTSNNNAQKEILPEEIIPLTEVQQKEIYDLLRKRNDIIRFDLHKSFMLIPFIDDLNKKIPYKDSATFAEQKVAIEKQISFLKNSLKKRDRETESDNESEIPASKKSKINNK